MGACDAANEPPRLARILHLSWRGTRSIDMAANVETLRPTPSVRVKQIALPTEHGGWGMLLEPMIAALAVTFSPGGAWIALMFVGAFLMRQPLKFYVLDRRGMRIGARAAAALRYLILYAVVAAIGVAGTAATCT